jgi:hypothetical protein
MVAQSDPCGDQQLKRCGRLDRALTADPSEVTLGAAERGGRIVVLERKLGLHERDEYVASGPRQKLARLLEPALAEAKLREPCPRIAGERWPQG